MLHPSFFAERRTFSYIFCWNLRAENFLNMCKVQRLINLWGKPILISIHQAASIPRYTPREGLNWQANTSELCDQWTVSSWNVDLLLYTTNDCLLFNYDCILCNTLVGVHSPFFLLCVCVVLSYEIPKAHPFWIIKRNYI